MRWQITLLTSSPGEGDRVEPGNAGPTAPETSYSTMVNLIELGWPATITITTMIIAVPVVIHVAVARGVGRSVPITTNEIYPSLACVVAAAIGSPILELIEWSPQVHWLIILRAQRLNQYGARIVELWIGKSLNIQSTVIVGLASWMFSST